MIEGRMPQHARAAVLCGTVMVMLWMAASGASAQGGASTNPGSTVGGGGAAAAPPDSGGSMLVGPAPGAGERWSLARCVATALERNVDARAAHARTAQARGAALGAWGGLLPSISTDLVYSRVVPDKRSSFRGLTQSQKLFADTIPRPTFATRDEFRQVGAGATTNLISVPAWSEKRRQDHLARSAEEGEAEARNRVVFLVKQQYFDLVKAQRLAEVSHESEHLARDEEVRADALFQVGTVARGDVLKARARRATTQLDRIRAENQVEIQRSKLKQLVGLKPDVPLEIEAVLNEAVAVPDSASAVQKALKERPELSRALAAERAARSGLTGARFRRLPQVTGSLNVNRTRIDERLGFDFSSADSATVRYATQWRGEVRLSLPIFDGFALEGGMKEAKGALLDAEASRKQAEIDVAVEVQQAWLSLREAQERIGVAREGLASAEEDYKFSKGRYDLGAGTILELLNAEVSLSQAKQSYVEALADAHVAEAALERAIGERRY